MSKILISGLVNIEITLGIKEFPISYFPIDYPFFGIQSSVSGVGYNIAKALQTLGDDVSLASFAGNDFEGRRVKESLIQIGVKDIYIEENLKATPQSLVLFDQHGKRQIYCDLKDIQDKLYEISNIEGVLKEADIVSVCNINFARSILREARKQKKIIATDVHVLGDIHDTYNKEFMENANILFLSDENIKGREIDFLYQLKSTYPCDIIVLGRGGHGAMMYLRKEDHIYKFDAVKVGEVINTVGAGDALFSGFLHYYSKGYPEVECLKRAELFASNKIRFNGASCGFINENELELLYKQYEVGIIKL